ncbi:unnamed protein product [Trypanosoma congolense IL3000]|uniref:WGS project CAEQ00000000 data, annotated contig 441 n=1 Tax=Trypanosoma congolense (strain IL3000) TaxID=1068625 RepID=F9WFZ0_TRYCI|nr:unnamed protein product [Trypanosoma congolense IL3000]
MLNPSPDTIQMPLAFVGTSVSREFTVRNTSEMPVHIRVTAPDELPQGLSVKGLREELVIPPTGEVNFAVVLSPMRVDKWRARLRVSVTENPFDDRELWVVGESFFEPISFHNTDPLFGDRLTLGYWYLSLAKEHTFTVRNNTPHPVRFEWAHPSRYLTFCPRVGRMRSGSSKDITVRLYSNTVTKESVSCMLRVTSIESVGGSEWDDRCKDQLGKSNASEIEEASVVADVESRYSARKLGDSAVEPPYQVTDYVKLQKTLLVSYACEQTNYKITMPMNNNSDLADRIVFPTTKIFQKQFLTLRIENLGSNVLPFSFDVQKCGGDSSSSNEVFSPFSVSPACGFIEPQKSEEVELAFSPKSVEVPEHMLVVNMHHSAKPQLLIPLQGSAECPLVHFNVPNCDYFETRVDGEVGGIIPPSTIPILFNVCGLNTKSVVTFKVINPTAYIHRFEWISNQNTSELAPFRCLTPAGSIASGKQCEMAFEYTSTSLATRESLWNFYIFDHIAIPFLLVGKVYEPSVFLSVNKVLFGGTLIGVRNERVVYLENREDTPIPFNFDSVSASAEKDFVGVKPSRGVIDPNSTLALTIWFSPKEEIAVNIKLICRVKRATNPLTINVKGEGLRTHFSLLMDNVNNSDASEPVQVPAFHCFDYNLGRVQVNTAVEKKLYLQNDGRCPLNFTAVSPEHRFFRLSGNICTLQAKQRAELTLSFLPTSTEVIRNLPLIFRIEKRTVYTIHLSAISYIPKLSLSFSKFDFGLCFISDYMMDQSPAPATLCIKNEENAESLTVECLLSKDKFFKIDANYLALSPEETQQLNISFTPSEVGEFLCDLKLLVNGIHATYVPIRGEGIIPKIDVSPRVARLGIARIGVTRTVELRLECRSGVPTTVSLAKCIDEELMARGVSITPNNTFTMRPGDIRTVTAVFKPPNRMVEFHREVSMIVCGKVVPFVVFTGACEDAEVHTDVQNVLFNNVMIGTVASRRVVIMNSGDISQRFSWELTPDTSKQIKIAPSGGVIRAHGEQICEFLYSPTSLGNSIRTAIMLEFDNAPPITLNVEAHCVDIVKPDTVLEFVCKVGSTVTKTVTIENPTDNVWTLRPVLNSKGWSALKILTVHPKGRGTLPITYAPLVYTGEKDVATMFIPYPSGDGRSILLEGMSLSMIDGTTSIEKTVEVTTTHQEVFELVNNTANILRFRSSVSWLNESVKNSVSVKMPMAIDVPARQKREIGVDITPFVEGVLHGTFIFNCSSHEGNSQSFEVALKVVPKTETLKAELVAAVRTLATYKIPITNNLPRSATFTTRVENGSDALFVDPHIAVAANSTAELLVRFFPLVHKEYPVATVTATSSEAGIVACKMKLNSIPPPHEGVTRISCSLGQSVEFTLKFTSYNKSNCEYSLRYCDESKACHFSRVGNQNNIRAPGCSRPEGQEVSVDMLYEPSQIGDIRQIIEVSSNTGVYTFPIVASCQPPQRQGPFAVRPGATTPLTFKNVFNEPLTVNITTDSPSFFVSKSVETVPPKKAIIIGVQYRQDDQQRNVHAAKLTVSGTHRCETISWLYYLKLVSADTNVPVS